MLSSVTSKLTNLPDLGVVVKGYLDPVDGVDATFPTEHVKNASHGINKTQAVTKDR